MSSTTVKQTTSIKIDKAVKDEAKQVFKALGLTMGEAINLFLHQVKLNQGLPFEVKIPNKLTRQVLEEGQAGKNIEDFSLDDLKRPQA